MQTDESLDIWETELSQPEGTCDPLCSVDDMSSEEFEGSSRTRSDLLKAISIGSGLTIGAAIIQHAWVAEHQVRTTNLGVGILDVMIVSYQPLEDGEE